MATLNDDVVSSNGTFGGAFLGITLPPLKNDSCTPRVKDEFNSAYPLTTGASFRNVEPRHTPTVINATFNVRNFWDGRANRVFNGETPFGPRDTAAGIWWNPTLGTVVPAKVPLEINNASLASQAVGPVLSDLEMHCTPNGPDAFELVGKKLVSRIPLQNQAVARTDSVLAPLINLTPGPGPKFIRSTLSYRDLIKSAFKPEFWTGSTAGGSPLDEANFALFFGLAVQAYEDTLISGQSKYDLIPRSPQDFTPPGGVAPIVNAQLPIRITTGFNRGLFRGLTRAESRGLDLFMGQISTLNPIVGLRNPLTNQPIIDPLTGLQVRAQKNGRCILCHNGPEFTSAAFTALAGAPLGVNILDPAAVPVEFLAEPMPFAPAPPGAPIPLDVPGAQTFIAGAGFGTYDLGFYDIGVTPLANDHGLGGNDPFGNPLAFAKQWEQAFLKAPQGEKCQLDPLTNIASCGPPATVDKFSLNLNFVDVNGAPLIMTPLLAPAKTDGSFKTPSLRNVQLTAPYFHNGSAKSLAEVLSSYNNGGVITPLNPNHHPEIVPLFFNATDIADITAFLNTLTDPRVRLERAPFDHPALVVPNGHTASGQDNANRTIQIPAVGSGGRAEPADFVDRLINPLLR